MAAIPAPEQSWLSAASNTHLYRNPQREQIFRNPSNLNELQLVCHVHLHVSIKLRLSAIMGRHDVRNSLTRAVGAARFFHKAISNKRHSSRPHSFRPWAGGSTDILIECSAIYTLRCPFMARITSREKKRFVSQGFCHCARPSLRFSGTRRFVICFDQPFQYSNGRNFPLLKFYDFKLTNK